MEADPILFEVPESFETEKLVIRAPLWGDGVFVNEAIRESIGELRNWMPWAQEVPEIGETEANIRKARLSYLERTDMRLHLFLKSNGLFIGSSGLHRINWQTRKFEIGYWLRTSCYGHGFMTEAVDGITRFAVDLLQANRIEIRCDSRNVRSAAVAERLGFKLEGVLRNDIRDVNGTLRDTKIYAKAAGFEY